MNLTWYVTVYLMCLKKQPMRTHKAQELAGENDSFLHMASKSHVIHGEL